MKYDLSAPNSNKSYRLITKGPECLIYVCANNINQAISLAKKAGYQVLSATRWAD
jgi:hypothetical protein